MKSSRYMPDNITYGMSEMISRLGRCFLGRAMTGYSAQICLRLISPPSEAKQPRSPCD